jgi:hypothetical protein
MRGRCASFNTTRLDSSLHNLEAKEANSLKNTISPNIAFIE